MVDVGSSHRGALVRQLLGEGEQGPGGPIEAGIPPVPGEPVNRLLIVDLVPEVV